MRLTATFTSLAALLVLPFVLADVVISNADVSADIVVPDQYIVKYKDNADSGKKKKHEEDVDKKAKERKKKGLRAKYDIPGLSGYTAEIAEADLKTILSSELVESVEKDTFVNHTRMIPHVQTGKRAMTAQTPAPWGLDRISHRSAPNATTPNSWSYWHNTPAGKNVRIYIVDTGIMISHSDFGGRAVWGANFVNDGINNDGNGHGTHVAATAMGTRYGVAKAATAVAVKVLSSSGSGSVSGVISGIQWSVKDARAQPGGPKKAVLNMSLGGGFSPALNNAVAVACNEGMTVVVAAGNSGADVGLSLASPASEKTAITVAATDIADKRPYWSNWGKLVDLFAPGVGVESAWIPTNKATATLSGTSMASPHVAGLAAYLIALENLSGYQQVTARILALATPNKVGDPGVFTPNLLGYNGSGK
ncbi:hypothetical protein OQA88_8596 [Cercophora sp. LCS_1]